MGWQAGAGRNGRAVHLCDGLEDHDCGVGEAALWEELITLHKEHDLEAHDAVVQRVACGTRRQARDSRQRTLLSLIICSIRASVLPPTCMEMSSLLRGCGTFTTEGSWSADALPARATRRSDSFGTDIDSGAVSSVLGSVTL